MLRDLVDRYDTYLIDMWGTVYDRGAGLFPRAAACLGELKRAGKRVILTSNAARPAGTELERQLGAAASAVPHDRLVTAGEVIRDLAPGPKGLGATLGTRYFVLGHQRNAGLLTDLGFVEVAQPQEAAFIVVAGLLHPDDATSNADTVFCQTRALLVQALEQRIPLLAAKSDWLTVFPDGRPWIGPGPLLQWYTEQGGAVRLIGKPARAYYDHCARFFSSSRQRVLAIGDHRETDIAGGASCGFDTLLITSGIERRLSALATFERGHGGGTPTYEAEMLEW